MPKLPPEAQKAARDYDPDSKPTYDPLEDGDYLVSVEKVVEYEGDKYDGVNLWLQVVRPRANSGDRLFERVSYSPKAAFKARQVFDAFGYEPDSDFDELVDDGAEAIAVVSTEVQKVGKNKGKLVNRIDEWLPATPEAVNALPQ
jgi:hypothetical protein